MKKLFKILLSVLGLLIATLIVLYLIYNKPLPKSEISNDADVLAQKMLDELHYNKYKNARYFEWSFADGSHSYKWDKKAGIVIVKWDDYIVDLNLNDTYLSIVTKKDKEVTAKEAKEVLNTAWDYFNNDSFWLVAPYKVFDKGTTRSIVNFEDGTKGLMITYASGGTTPGDSYVWKLDANGFPESYQMWVKIIPIGGLKATWDNWKKMENGVYLPSSHKLGPITLSMGDIRSYN